MSDTPASSDGLAAALDASDGFQILARALPDAVLIVRPDGTVAYASVLTADLLGQPAGEVVGRPFFDLVAEGDQRVFPPTLFEGAVGTWDFRAARSDGEAPHSEDRWLNASVLSPRLGGLRGTALGDALGDATLFLLRDFRDSPTDGAPTDKDIRDRQDLLRRALDATDNLVVMSDARAEDTPLVLVNERFLRVTGYTRDEVIGENCRFLQRRPDGTRDDDQDGVRELTRAIAAGESTNVTLRNYTKAGELFYNELFITPVHDRDGQLIYFVGVQNDVTDRVLNERDTLAQAPLLRAFFDSAPTFMGVVQRDSAGLMHRMANKIASDLFDRSAPEVAGSRSSELGFSEREDQRWRDAVEACRSSGESVAFDTRFPWDSESSMDGVRAFRVVVSRVTGQGTAEQGELYSYIGEDVTLAHRGAAERRLLAAAVDQAGESILVTTAETDPPGPTIVYANQAHDRVFGYEPGEAIGRTPRMYQGPKTDRAVLDRVRERIEAGEAVSAETINYRKDGSEFVLEWDIAPVKGDDGRIQNWVGTQRDVTERRQLEREVLEVQAREQERMARDLHDGLGQVLSGSAFMLSAVQSELASQGLDDLADRLDRVADHIQDAHRQARAIARGLFPIDIEADGLAIALQQLADGAADAYGIECSLESNEPVTLGSRDHAGHLYRIAQESIANAVRHGGAARVRLFLGRVGGDAAELAIEDDGSGIAPEALTGDSGIGLRSMGYRASRIGGDLDVRPLKGGGTRVAVRFDPDEPTGHA